MGHEAPGKSHRQGISVIELAEMFPTEDAATDWFVAQRWPESRPCPRCGFGDTMVVANSRPMPFRCKKCWKFFSVRTGTVLERSKVSLKKWAYAVYLCTTSLKGVSSMKLHRDLDVTQKTAWFMVHRIREALTTPGGIFSGPVEVDESYFGGKEGNKHASKKLRAGRGTVGKTAVVGAKDRETNKVNAKVTDAVDGKNLRQFVYDHVKPGAEVFTDEAQAYKGLSGVHHKQVKHSAGEYVDGMAHTNGIESFWSMLNVVTTEPITR